MKIHQKITLTFAAMAIVACGNNNSNPLSDYDSSSYMTGAERAVRASEIEQRFKQETAEYEKSIKTLEDSSNAQITALEARYSGMEKSLREQAAKNSSEWQTERQRFITQFNTYKKEQDAVIAELQTIVEEWETQAKTCQAIIDNPERQNFQGLLYRYEAQEALPRSIEWVNNSSKSYNIFFKMDLAHEAVQEIRVTPSLPEGLRLVRKSSDTWSIEGIPTLEIGQNQESVRSIHTIEPVIQLNQIADEATRNLIAQQSFQEKIMIVVYKNQIPTVEATNRSGGSQQ